MHVAGAPAGLSSSFANMQAAQGLGLYARISQASTDGTTMATDRQEAECRAKAAALGLTITKVYIDQGKSASSKKVVRPAYEAMLSDARAGRIGGVITWAYDRLTRQPEQLGPWLDLADGGFKLITVAGELDLASDSGRLVARMLAAVAEGEVRRKGARQVSANRQRAEQGLPFAKVRAFGYRTGGMEPDPEEALLIQEAVAGLLAGTHSIHGVTNDWNRRGIQTTRGLPWNRTSMKRVLTAWRNCGLLAYKDGTEVFEAQWPAIVPKEDVEALRALLSQPGRNTTTKDTTVRNLLSHIMRCAKCQEAGRPSYVGAITQARGVRAYRCPTCFTSIDRVKADAAIVRRVADLLSDPGYQLDVTAATVRDKRAELANVVATGDSLSRMWTAGEISLDQFRLMNEGPSNARKALEAEITSLVERDAVTALVDGLRLTEGPYAANTVGAIHANAEVITGRFEALDLTQQRTVIRGLLPYVLLLKAVSGGRQSPEATARRIVTPNQEEVA